MIFLASIAAKAKAAWSWVVAHWQWLLPPLGLLVWYLTRPKNVTVASGEVVGHDVAVTKADQKAAEESAATRAAAEAELNRVAKEQAAKSAELTNKLEKEADTALDSPEATNDFLQHVSKDMRK